MREKMKYSEAQSKKAAPLLTPESVSPLNKSNWPPWVGSVVAGKSCLFIVVSCPGASRARLPAVNSKLCHRLAG